jgi:hypothetical protein
MVEANKMKLDLLFSKRKKMNKKGWVPLLIWGGAALAAGIGYLINATKPAASSNSAAGIISAIPIWGWIVIGLVVLVLLKR